jgi:hypothetical protein
MCITRTKAALITGMTLKQRLEHFAGFWSPLHAMTVSSASTLICPLSRNLDESYVFCQSFVALQNEVACALIESNTIDFEVVGKVLSQSKPAVSAG